MVPSWYHRNITPRRIQLLIGLFSISSVIYFFLFEKVINNILTLVNVKLLLTNALNIFINKLFLKNL